MSSSCCWSTQWRSTIGWFAFGRWSTKGFSGITVQLRRRADLVPNLVETVKGYATHERETLDQVTAHRTDAMNAGSVAATAQADNAMTAMLGRLFAVAEAYPELKADANFRELQGELSSLETELQSARRYYNATARDLNTRIFSFPDMLFATPMGFKEEPYYEDADAGDPERAQGRIPAALARCGC